MLVRLIYFVQDLDVGASPYATPGSIGPRSSAATTPAAAGLGSSASKDTKVTKKSDEKLSPREEDDPRPQPEYDMVFRQAVSAEDVYLGMGNKNPTTASCEELVVRTAILVAIAAYQFLMDFFYSLKTCRICGDRWYFVEISILGQDTTAWRRCK